ncbi:MAG: hypothetical protein ABI210_05785 [Abditibacteriaceae bacterium]
MNARKVLLLLAGAGIFAHIEDDGLHLACMDGVPAQLAELARKHKPKIMVALIEAENGLKIPLDQTDRWELIYCIALLNAHINPDVVYQAAGRNQEQSA